jgi:uncharacterized membrane protein
LLKSLVQSRWFSHALLLLVWLAIGSGLRFTHIAAKAPWNDEFTTLVFSLGNSFRTVPLDRAIATETLLMPVQLNPEASIRTVVQNLLTESTHPPIYFVLAHLWMKLFPSASNMPSFWAARSLAAIFGVASIPAMFGLGWLAFRSRLVGQIAAAMMAVSPFGIYLAQEFRHYTLTILWIVASLCCLVAAARAVERRIALPSWVGFMWVAVNSLGIASHYLFIVTHCAEALVLVGLWIWNFMVRIDNSYSYWRRLYAAAIGTLAGVSIWIPIWLSVPKQELTHWVYDFHPLNHWLLTIGRFLAWTITMVSLLPVEGTTQPIQIASILILSIFIIWLLPISFKGLKFLVRWQGTCRETQVFIAFISAAIALLLSISFGLGADLSIAARYQFVYFPALLTLLGAVLAVYWNGHFEAGKNLTDTEARPSPLLGAKGKKAVAIVWLMGFIGALTVVTNFSYQKPDRADLLVPIIQRGSQSSSVLIATAHENREQIGKMMALAWEFKHLPSATDRRENSPLFLLAHQEPSSQTAKEVLQRTLSQLPRPLDLWMVNFFSAVKPEGQNCRADFRYRSLVNGYKYRLYHCP